MPVSKRSLRSACWLTVIMIGGAAAATFHHPQPQTALSAPNAQASSGHEDLRSDLLRRRHVRPGWPFGLRSDGGQSSRVAMHGGDSRCASAAVCTDIVFQDGFEEPCIPVGSGCGVAEICGNGLDDDCNGAVDDGCACQPGSVQSCFNGFPGRRNVGVCNDGSQTCIGGEFGSWSSCVGGVTPSAEICDGNDNDCDGCIDD